MSRRGTVNRSRSMAVGRARGQVPVIRITRPQTPQSSNSSAPPPTAPRSLTPPGRIEQAVTHDVEHHTSSPLPGTSGNSGSLAGRTSTPERGNSSELANFLDSSAVSSIPAHTSTRKPDSRRQLLEKRKQLKKDEKTKALLAYMEALDAFTQLHEEKAKAEKMEGKLEQLKLEIAKETAAKNHYSTCIEKMCQLKGKQAALEIEKAKRDDIVATLLGQDRNQSEQPCSEEELAKIQKIIEELKTSLENMNGALIARNVSCPVGEVEEASRLIAALLEKMVDLEELRKNAQMIAELVTVLDKLEVEFARKEELLEKKNQLIIHLASLQTSLWTYKKRLKVID